MNTLPPEDIDLGITEEDALRLAKIQELKAKAKQSLKDKKAQEKLQALWEASTLEDGEQAVTSLLYSKDCGLD